MKIKEIKLYGFKSFYEETKFLLNPGITAFVGPNGSGKSNIFDALRWIFGEQSMKALRCERTEDLIHMSHDGKNDANFTEAAIIIDNEDYFPQFGSEFEIKRRYYRTGESEFYLNRVKCRLQDIQALFLNSGTLTYSFLELAEIKKIIGGNTKEMFDDVSGILKYQERRDQTQRRLEATEQDLLRLEDVIAEMVRSIRSLKRQARQAQLYHQMKEEYKVVNLTLMKKEHAAAWTNIKELKEQTGRQESEKQVILQAIKSLEDERKDLKDRVARAETDRQSVQFELDKLDQTLAELTRAIAEKEGAVRELTLASERRLASLKEKEDFLAANQNRATEFDRDLAGVSDELDRLNAAIESARTAIDEKNKQFFARREELDDREKAALAIGDQTQHLKSELINLELNRKNKESILSRIAEECRTMENELQASQRSVRELNEELDRILKEQAAAGDRLDQANQRLEAEAKKFAEVEEDLTAKQDEINECKILIDTLTRRIGKPENLKQIEQTLGPKLVGLFRDSLEVTPGYESAVDACLGDVFNYLLVDGFGPPDLAQLPEGKIGLVNAASAAAVPNRPEDVKNYPAVTSFARFKSGRQYLERYLDGYLLVNDLTRALKLAEQYSALGFVTKEGILFKNGLVVCQKGDAGYFKISQSLQETKSRLETLQNQVQFLHDERTRLLTEIEGMKEQIEKERNGLFNINIKKSELGLRLSEFNKNLDKANKEAEELRRDRDAAAEELNGLAQKVRAIAADRDNLTAELEAKKAEKERIQKELRAREKEIEEQNCLINDLLLKAGIRQERKNSLEKNRADLVAQIAVYEAEIARIRDNTVTREIEQLNVVIKDFLEQLAAKKDERTAIETRRPDKILEEITRNQGTLYDRLTEQQKRLEEIQQAVMQLNYEIFQHQHQKDELFKKAHEEFATDLEAYTPEDLPDPEVKRQEIRERLEKLGEINPLALEAYEQEKKRLDEFFSQRNDIIAAKQSLLKSIDELDTRARERFVNTFGQVKEKFNTVFANFFEGGQADLVLTNPENPLTSQVEIVVRMANKRIKTINQLSGGEQTLLAVSLLLAFYLVKPAPFCILDEIDAPLDDANVVRFNRFLRELSQRTQVVIITHNRATMEFADYLYGLTSERPGQSKVISVKLADLESIEAVPAAE
jgi:chromosome segregation protein